MSETTTTTTVKELYETFLSAFQNECRAAGKTSKTLDKIFELNLNPSKFYEKLFSEGYERPKSWPKKESGNGFKAASHDDTRKALKAVNRLVSAFGMRNKRLKEKKEKVRVERLTALFDGNLPEFINSGNIDKILDFIDMLPIIESEKYDDQNARHKLAVTKKFDLADNNNEKSPGTGENQPLTGEESPKTGENLPGTDESLPASADRVESSDQNFEFDSVALIESLQSFVMTINKGESELDEKNAKLAHKLCKQLIDLAQQA